MFAKFKENKLYKFLTKPLGFAGKGCATETAEEPNVSADSSAKNAATAESVRKDVLGKS